MRISIAQLNSLAIVSLLMLLAMTPLSTGERSVTAVALQPTAIPFHPRPVALGDSSQYSPPDFTSYRDVATRKAAFYDYLLPMIHESNAEVLRERAWLEQTANALLATRTISSADLLELERIEQRYKLDIDSETVVERVGELLRRVDVVPASLVLAQAAKESGWGTSRFAREGNNFFGIWCFYEGCGLTPLNRLEGRSHEVATFVTVEESVRYYIRTINTHDAYEDLRLMRSDARARNERLRGAQMAEGLGRYSERGPAYIKEIQHMIQYNQLSRFTLNQKV